jgi:hypothetical protein
MTIRSLTTPVRLVKFGDVWNGPAGAETVTGIANSFRPTNMDITLFNPALNSSRVVTLNRDQWFAVQRDE